MSNNRAIINHFSIPCTLDRSLRSLGKIIVHLEPNSFDKEMNIEKNDFTMPFDDEEGFLTDLRLDVRHTPPELSFYVNNPYGDVLNILLNNFDDIVKRAQEKILLPDVNLLKKEILKLHYERLSVRALTRSIENQAEEIHELFESFERELFLSEIMQITSEEKLLSFQNRVFDSKKNISTVIINISDQILSEIKNLNIPFDTSQLLRNYLNDLTENVLKLKRKFSTNYFETKTNEVINKITALTITPVIQEGLQEYIEHFRLITDEFKRWLILSLSLNFLNIMHDINELNQDSIDLFLQQLKPLDESSLILFLVKLNNRAFALNRLSLLTRTNLVEIINDETSSKSCYARLNGGIGLQQANDNEKQVNWGYFCDAVEAKIIHKIEHSASLKQVFHYARNMRRNIAMIDTPAYSNFGLIRIDETGDFYAKDTISVVSSEVFESLIKVVCKIPNTAFEKLPSMPAFSENRFFKTSSDNIYITIFKNENYDCNLPEVSLILNRNCATNEINRIDVNFSPQTLRNLEDSLNKLDETYFPILKNKSIQDEKFLITLGKLIFHFIRLYPLIRGTGAVGQWIARSFIKMHFNQDISDIKLGQNRDIPYDIYAHLVKSAEEYADAFKDSVEHYFQMNKQFIKPQ